LVGHGARGFNEHLGRDGCGAVDAWDEPIGCPPFSPNEALRIQRRGTHPGEHNVAAGAFTSVPYLYRDGLDSAVLYQGAFRRRNFILNKFPDVVFVTRSAMNLHHA
jgi:hypothetical protein